MEELPRKENKMGVLPVGRLILTMSAPMVLSMLFQALYNVVDSVFVARLGQDAMNAVSLAFPLQTVLIGVSVGTGVGMNALVSRSLGERNFDRADAAANTGIFLYLCSAVLFGLIGMFPVPTTVFSRITRGSSHTERITSISASDARLPFSRRSARNGCFSRREGPDSR